MSTDPITEAPSPAQLPPLFTTVPERPRPGRVRGRFTLGADSPAGPVSLQEARTRHTTGPAPAPGAYGVGEVDWGLVSAFRTQAAARLAQVWDGTSPALTDRAAQEETGWRVIEDLLADHTSDALDAGTSTWTGQQRARYAQAIFDAVFRLGRLQPLVDDDRVEDIFILGGGPSGRTWLNLVDGSRVAGPVVADSDEELVDFVRFLGTRSDSSARPFSQGTPRLHLKLDDGSRLAATAWVMTRPSVVIRRHRLKVDTLDAWVERGCMTPACANLLSAAVKAAMNITVAGPMAAGKTTLVRALSAQIPRQEVLGTFETEYELFLGESGQHDIVFDWEARPGVGEIGADGRAAGAFTLAEALEDSFRYTLDRQIVGEVRGPEVWTMIKAMESSTGSISTTHATSARGCIHKLVTCAMEAGKHVSRDVAMEKLAGCLDLVVQLRRAVDTLPDGSSVMRRWVSEVALVRPGEREVGYSLVHLFGPDQNGPATASGFNPKELADLEEFGFDPDLYTAEAGQRWGR